MDLEPGKLYQFKYPLTGYYDREPSGKIKDDVVYFTENDYVFILNRDFLKEFSRYHYKILFRNKIYYMALDFEVLKEKR
jgi:hypothetical protein